MWNNCFSQKNYRNTPLGRCTYLVHNYKEMDEKNGFGDVIDFDAEWMFENILSKPCAHCGEADWHKLGCNRIDNTKPHTMDNVEPCCFDCNNKLNYVERSKRVDQIDPKTGDVLHQWNSTCEAAKILGLHQGHISECAANKKKQYKGYLWKYVME